MNDQKFETHELLALADDNIARVADRIDENDPETAVVYAALAQAEAQLVIARQLTRIADALEAQESPRFDLDQIKRAFLNHIGDAWTPDCQEATWQHFRDESLLVQE